jgi:hypothetical protein
MRRVLLRIEGWLNMSDEDVKQGVRAMTKEKDDE